MKTTILGGGIAGLATAIALKNAGIEYTIFEAAPEIKPVGAGLGLAANAMMGLQRLGIGGEIMQEGHLLPAFTIYDERGKVITHTDSTELSRKYGADNFTIHRAALHRVLLEHAGAQHLITGKRCMNFQNTGNAVSLHFDDGSTHSTESLIVAEGIHSPIRQQLLPGSVPRYAGYTCWRAVIDGTDLNIDTTSETWGAGKRFGLVPLKDNRLYWFACINAVQNDARYRSYKAEDLLREFENFHQPIPEVLRRTHDTDLIWGDIYDLKPIPHYAFGNILLIGDAAHATTPNMGQGACQAIEDAVMLGNILRKTPDFAAAFKVFEESRLRRTHYIIRQSRRVGELAQTTNKALILLRNTLFRLMPPSLSRQQLEKLYAVDFEAK